ncbi:uncharacterized protein LOC143193470 [Rhynchophorus ferrugineus]|uniref:G-protein coupled receptors family 1 profile domain-containing protein n=1 Tax=Rhynchophorus ferrugineus TaxID=354439 RepID=A0A834IH09_RHYFE|nr:hypothetical protein GWI33_005768 [Rhynchophorus ferrugineus]
MESHYHWLVTVGLVTSSVIAVTANSFLLFVFARRRSLRTVPNRFVINLLVTNLLSSLLLIPLLLVDQDAFPPSQNITSSANGTIEQLEEGVLIKEEIISSTSDVKIIETSEKFLQEKIIRNEDHNEDMLCYFAQASTSFVCTASIFSILIIGINQYFGVIHSLRYHFYINKLKASIFILSSWLAAFVCAVLSTLTYSDSSLWHFCSRSYSENGVAKVLNTAYACGYFVVVILAPFVAICIIYICIYTAAHQNSERMRKSTSASSNCPLEMGQSESSDCPPSERDRGENTLPKVHSAPNFSALENSHTNNVVEETKIPRVKRTISDRNNFITNLKHKISNASMFRNREETRAAKISVLVIFMVLICYIPYGLTLVLTSGCIQVNPGQIFNYLSLVLLVFSNVMSPFLFGYRNKRVKREIGKMLGLVQSSQNFSFMDNYRPPENIVRNRSFEGINETVENSEPLLEDGHTIPEVVVTCKMENEKKSILKRVGSGWNSYKKCNFITVPDSCLSDARGSFSSASTQVSNDE